MEGKGGDAGARDRGRDREWSSSRTPMEPAVEPPGELPVKPVTRPAHSPGFGRVNRKTIQKITNWPYGAVDLTAMKNWYGPETDWYDHETELY
jgi:hypothetical protein